jgi:hypothetical protein
MVSENLLNPVRRPFFVSLLAFSRLSEMIKLTAKWNGKLLELELPASSLVGKTMNIFAISMLCPAEYM